jgi:hypothetical protein
MRPMDSRRLLDRRGFLALAASVPALAACTTNSTGTVPLPTAPVVPFVPLPAGTTVSDLRYPHTIPTTTPPLFAGYAPLGDANALFVPPASGGTPSPATSPVPGTLATGSYASNERYVIKVPAAWNGKLIVAGTPSFRSEFANDFIWGDFALANGYAFASSNKGVLYNAIVETLSASPSPAHNFPIPFNLAGLEALGFSFRFGALNQSGNIANWNTDFATLTASAQNFLAQYFGQFPTKTYAVGLSNGGAQVRSLVQNFPSLVDGGVDWSGVYWSPTLNILTYLPKFLANMPAYIASGYTSASAAAAIQAAGYPADIVQSGNAPHPSLWEEYYSNQASFYSDLTLFAYALFLDPSAAALAGAFTPNGSDPVHLPGTSSTATDLAQPAARAAYAQSGAAAATIASFSHTGSIGKPLISIAGTSDMFITAANNAAPYLAAVNARGNGGKYWQYLVSGGTHVDTFAPFGYGLQAQLPFAWAAFNQLAAIVERGFAPPGAGTAQTVMTTSQIRNS